MRLVSDPRSGEVDLTASAEELMRLANAVALGEGLVRATSAPGSDTLTGVGVKRTSGPGALVHRDTERQILMISGDPASRAALAENLQSMATAEDGGHLHIDYFPGHFYLAEGSVPLVVNSPHGGMPTR
ncbi:Imm32 family immunity protein [Streptomyces sp. B21-083]|uniref:Imm32 family immunity protein n=1 Tax=Streptomyces sp. B21-083 TaxID=3039410 RepID=UPI002FF26B06